MIVNSSGQLLPQTVHDHETGGWGHHASLNSPEQSLTADCFPSSEPVSANAATIRSVDITTAKQAQGWRLEQPEPSLLIWHIRPAAATSPAHRLPCPNVRARTYRYGSAGRLEQWIRCAGQPADRGDAVAIDTEPAAISLQGKLGRTSDGSGGRDRRREWRS